MDAKEALSISREHYSQSIKEISDNAEPILQEIYDIIKLHAQKGDRRVCFRISEHSEYPFISKIIDLESISSGPFSTLDYTKIGSHVIDTLQKKGYKVLKSQLELIIDWKVIR